MGFLAKVKNCGTVLKEGQGRFLERAEIFWKGIHNNHEDGFLESNRGNSRKAAEENLWK